jgi:autotransporter strand-loop-strand O-heptosyltransferase
MDKIKVLYIPQHLSCGGMPQFLLKRIQCFIDYTDSIEVYVIEYNDYGKHFPTQRNQIKELLGDRFYSLDDDKMKVLDIVNEINPNIIHLDEMPELIGNDELFKKLYNNDRKWHIVETCHNSTFNPDKNKRFNPDMYAFCTSWHEEVFGNMDAQFVTIPYPIDRKIITKTDKFIAKAELGFEANKKHVINVGIWTPGKNQAEGIEIARKYPEMKFHFIGVQAGNFQSYWEPLMKDLPDNVVVWGERSDIDKFMMAADIFMFNSTFELNPLVLREAIGYGLPIIARKLPQYDGMYDKYILPLDIYLGSLHGDKFYNIPTEYSSLNFALRHEEAYKKILSLPIHKQGFRIINHYVDNPYLEVISNMDGDFKVQFCDEKGSIAYENTIKSNHWVKLNKQYFIKWTAKVWHENKLIYNNTLDLNGKRVYIAFESKSLGDTLAWIPYVEEFRKKHQCKLIVSTFWNKILDYPEIEFVEPGTLVKDIYALYRLGYFYDLNKLPFKPQTISLQNVATAILGLDYTEIVPKLAHKPEVPKIGNYVTIATNSTAGMKFWGKEHWQATINWLVSEGYEVYNVSAEPNPFDNCTQITTPSLESKMDWIAGAEFQISLGSGLSWLAFALQKKVFMIANFSEDWAEFKTNCIKITNKSVCNGCWNNPNFRFDGSWDYCPIHKETNRQWECQLSVTPDMVINEIKKAGF